jgi:hypothetical protein
MAPLWRLAVTVMDRAGQLKCEGALDSIGKGYRPPMRGGYRHDW